ncbi:MAG: DNA-processing protein DprA [Hyphomicrobiaceae bacterium]
MTDRQRLAWLQLIRSEHVGPVTFRDLVNHYGGAEDALEALPELSRRGGKGRAIRIASLASVEKELATARRIGAEPVVAGEPGYPPWLEHVEAPPPVIYVKGGRELAAAPIIAMVGSRDGSAAGRKFARTLAAQLGAAGYVVASGLARGVDGEAHMASLATGTIAVVAGGIDVVYPPEHEALHREIAERGMLISERPPGLPPKGQDFPRRNRIISGISRGVIVIEAARRSGTLITARMAGEQGREVFAVPGHPLDPRAVGTNMLLKQGATLVTSADDVLEVLAPLDDRVVEPQPRGLFDSVPVESCADQPGTSARPVADTDRERVVSALGPAPVEIDELCRTTALSARTVRAILLELDLAGRLQRHRNQLVSLDLEADG